MKNGIEFDVPGEAKHSNEEMQKIITTITRDVYGVSLDLSKVDFRNYYRSDGARVTKTLVSMLRKTLSKEQVQEKYPGYGKAVAELYTIGLSLVVAIGDKSLLGEGVYENSKTCFRSGGENDLSKVFINKYKRCKAFVLYKKGSTTPSARCIAYLAGGRNIYLTNFYWRDIPPNRLYFITGVKKIFKLKKVLWRNNPKFFLPVYKNGDSVHIYDERTKLPKPYKLMPCPHCGKLVRQTDLYSEDLGAYRLMGCTLKCARKHSPHFKKCGICKEYIYNGELRQYGDKWYCHDCARTYLTTCKMCGGMFSEKECSSVDGNLICQGCQKKMRTCLVCKKLLFSAHAFVTLENSKHICKECLPLSGFSCSICRSFSSKKLKKQTTIYGDIHLCDECQEPLLGTIQEAASCR